MARTRNNNKELPRVHEDLDGFNVKVGEFGELKTSYRIEDINAFLNKRLADKKLINRSDYDELRG